MNDLPKGLYQELSSQQNVDVKYDPVATYDYDQRELNTKSKYHQFLDYKDAVVKRYVKGTLGAISFFRSHPMNKRVRLSGILQTTMKDGWYLYVAGDSGDYATPSNVQLWSYNDDVIELYAHDDIDQFEKWNSALLEDGRLVEYDPTIAYRYNNVSGMLEETARVVKTTRKAAVME
jgi:hypothetical protein